MSLDLNLLTGSQFPLLVAAVLFGIAGLGLVWGLGSMLNQWRDPVRRRLAGMDTAEAVPEVSIGRRIALGLGPLGRMFLPAEGKERSKIDRLLFLAGFRSPGAASTFFGFKTALALGLPAIWLMSAGLLPTLTSRQVWFFAAVALLIGMIGPNYWLEKRAEARQQKLKNGFPDALDLLVICVEAGLGLAAAIERVSQELRFSHPELGAELALVNAQMRAGVEREAALKGLADRTGLKDIRGLVGLLVQTLRFGTSVADTLRVFAEEFRDQRMQAAEEQAAKIGTKLIFPLITCMFPAFFVISVGPAAVQLIEFFKTRGA